MAAETVLEPIEPGKMYPLSILGKRYGWGQYALRTARRKGLRVRYVGRVGYVDGSDLIAYIREHGDEQR